MLLFNELNFKGAAELIQYDGFEPELMLPSP
jgi:hypothetical protein